jgi:hypothetical protein
MASLTDVRREIARYAAEHTLWTEVSGLYDLFPAKQASAHLDVSHHWPARWPNGKFQGLYLYFDDARPEPQLLYVGKSSGKSSCIRMRLNRYFDAAAKRATKACLLLQEWNGHQRPWGTEPRYVVTVAMEPDCDSGACLGAGVFEKHLIELFRPPENTSLKPSAAI